MSLLNFRMLAVCGAALCAPQSLTAQTPAPIAVPAPPVAITPPVPGQPGTVPNVVPGAPIETPPVGKLPSRMVGDAAPPLSIAAWVRGQPVGGGRFEPGRVYVVEFWATWCPPCRKSIPHLTELQQRYKDTVTVIGVTSREPEGVDHVEKFVKQNGDKFGYAVAWDDMGKSDQAWMEDFGQEGIPTAFVVDKAGRVAWIGHPLEDLDSVLEQVVSGKFDLAAAVVRARREAEVRLKAAPLKEKLDDQLGEARFDDAAKTLDQLIALDPKIMGEYAVLKFMMLATGARDYDRAYKHAESAIAGTLRDDARLLGLLAWAIAEDPAIERRDWAIAERAAARANEVTGGKSSAALAALARVKLQSEPGKAIELQTRAVELESNRTLKEEYQVRLDQYRAKPPAPPIVQPKK